MKHYDNTKRSIGTISTLIGFILLGLAFSAARESMTTPTHGGAWIAILTLIVIGSICISRGLGQVSHAIQHREVFHYTDPRINKIIYPKSQ